MFEIEFEENERNVGGPANQAETDAALVRFLEDVANFAENAFQRHVPVGDTMRLYESIFKSHVEKSAGGFSVSVGLHEIPSERGESPHYGLFVDRGTGLFGPEHTLIYPEHGNIMVFTASSNEWVIPHRAQSLFAPNFGTEVFTRWVKGQRGQHFFERVYAETKAYVKVKKRELAKSYHTSL